MVPVQKRGMLVSGVPPFTNEVQMAPSWTRFHPLSLIPQLLQKDVELGCFSVPSSENVDRGLKEGHFCAMSWGHDELPADPQSAICSPRRRPVPFASIDGTPNSLAQFDRRSIQGLARAGPRLWPHAKALLTSQGPDCPVQAVVPYVASRRCRRVRPHRRTTPCSS